MARKRLSVMSRARLVSMTPMMGSKRSRSRICSTGVDSSRMASCCWRMTRSRSKTRTSMMTPMSKKAIFFSDMKLSNPSSGDRSKCFMIVVPVFLSRAWKAPRKARVSRPALL